MTRESPPSIMLASTNPAKIDRLRDCLSGWPFHFNTVDKLPPHDPPEESGDTHREIAESQGPRVGANRRVSGDSLRWRHRHPRARPQLGQPSNAPRRRRIRHRPRPNHPPASPDGAPGIRRGTFSNVARSSRHSSPWRHSAKRGRSAGRQAS